MPLRDPQLRNSGEPFISRASLFMTFPIIGWLVIANPGLYPVCVACPSGSIFRRIRLTVTEPWESGGPQVLALSEILLLDGNRTITRGAKVEASSSREIPPA
jgi:hypothetical protein